jgi:hypothetical protein
LPSKFCAASAGTSISSSCLGTLRRRRSRARYVKLAAAIAIIPLIFLCFESRRPPRQQATAAAPGPREQKVKFINKEELFALFPHRPIAIIGKPGHQQVLFMDEMGNR